MSALQDQIAGDAKRALKARDQVKIAVTRLLLADIHNQEIHKRRPLTEEEVIAVLAQSAKKHQDAIAQFETGKRADLVAQETAELKIITSYLPTPLSAEELRSAVAAAVQAVHAEGPKDFGKVMQAVMQEVHGRAAGSEVSKLVKEILENHTN